MDSPLTPSEIAALLEAAMATLRAELGALPERVTAWHPAAGEGCAKEVVGHLVETERRGFAGRIRIILGADRPALQSWDQNAVARARRAARRGLREALAARPAGVTPATGGAVGGRIVTGERQREVHPERRALGDDLGLAQMDERRVDRQLLALHGGLRGHVRHPLPGA